MTALYVTHDQAEAAVLGDRVGVMRDGLLLQMAPPNEIYNRPATLFVANFTGASNEVHGRMIEDGIVDVGGQQMQVSAMQALSAGDAVRIAFRPESFALGRRDAVNAYRARVFDCRYLGTQTVYDIELLGRRLEAMELGTATRYEIGSEIDVSLPPQACWAYPDTGPVDAAQ
jgi:iron(III) transport system ATP-binding protein